MPEHVQQIPVQEAPAQEIRAREVYVGPRPFERTDRELFFGRDREISELLSLVISSRVVLCYAPSGAGKTSLINAGLLPRLEGEGFEVLPSSRVKGLVPEGIDQRQVPNFYIFNVLLSLAGKGGAPEELASRSLAEHLSNRPHQTDQEGFPAPRILIFDQFEELLTSYPERWQEREGFFHQVRDALGADPLLRVLFSLREDFLARVEPFMRLLKPYQQARFRLALLGAQGAGAAITGPLRGTGRRFKEGVAAALVEELLKERVETAQGEAVEVVGEYVEPVQLQVVCRNLWTSLPPGVQEISSEHLKAYGNVDQALQEFYEDCLAEAKTKLGANEQSLREWFEKQLITPAGTRGIVFRDARQTAGLLNPIVDFLEDRHLIRGEWRAGSRWYELTHDRLIEPIQQANERWRARRQARRNRWIVTAAVSLFALVLAAGIILRAGQPPSTLAVNATAVNATAEVVAQSTAQVQVVQANEKTADATSRQLAAQALLVDDPDLSLLLAIEANKQADTQEARRSLHKVLSRQIIPGEKFLREFNPQIVSPRIVKRLKGHTDWVRSVAFSPDSRQIVSGSKDMKLIIWDAATGEQVGPPLGGHNSEVWSVAFSPIGNLFASAGLDGQILLWDASKRERIGPPLLGHEGWVTSVAFSPDGKRLASGGSDGKIRIWDVATGEQVGPPLSGHKDVVWSVAWSPDGKMLASGSADSMILLWDTGTRSEVRTLSGHQGLVRSVTWSPDGQSLASGSVVEEGKATWGEAFLWNVLTGEVSKKLVREDNQPVRVVAFDPNGTILAIGQEDGAIALWDVRSDKILGKPLKGHSQQVTSIAFSPDGKYLVSGSIDSSVVLWDLLVSTRSVVFSPEGDHLAASEGTAISLWDLSDEAVPPMELSEHTDDVLALTFSPDGSTLASAGRDDTVRLWDTKTGEEIGRPLSGHSDDVFTLDFNPDGEYLVSAGQDGSVLLWYFTAGQQQVRSLMHYPGPVIKATFSLDGRSLYLGSKDGKLVTLDLASGATQVDVLPGLQAGESLASLAIHRDGQKGAYFRDMNIPAVDDGRRAHGIVISQSDQSFDPAKNPGDIDFIVMHASSGLNMDGKFDEFLKSIQAIPIRGAYHFFDPNLSWQKQADLFLSVVKDKGFYFFVLDVEKNPNERNTTLPSDVEKWLKYVDERVDQKILLTTSPSFYNSVFGPNSELIKDFPLFIMQYPSIPDRNGSPFLPTGVQDWKIWQYTEGKGEDANYGLAGGYALLAVYNGTVTDMWKWLDIPTFTIYDRVSGERSDSDVLSRVSSLNGIAFSPEGSSVAYGGEQLVSLLDAGSGQEITTLSTTGMTIASVIFSPDGKTLAAGTEDGTILLWDLSLLDTHTDREPYLEIACSLVGRDFTDSEWAQFFGDIPKSSTCP